MCLQVDFSTTTLVVAAASSERLGCMNLHGKRQLCTRTKLPRFPIRYIVALHAMDQDVSTIWHNLIV
jgi:hypothetical protein